VGDNGKGVVATADQYRTGGSTDLTCKLYPEGRHEMLNETNRDDVMADVVHWLDRRFG
jgi:alpha-beta hydrolase superfamily lysophospholipase